MCELRHTKPCKACPWKRDSAAGWLGAASPEDFLMATLTEVEMPCHAAVDYEDPEWEDSLDDVPLCAGALVFLKNHMKSPRDAKLNAAVRSVEPDTENVFQWGPEFLAHHRRENG